MFAIPFGAIGMILGHLAMGRDLSFMSFIGLLALSGIVVNDSLILVDTVNRKRAAGRALAQALVFLACAAKSNAVYVATKRATRDAKDEGTREVPLRFRNAPTKLAKSLDHGKGYRYAHDEPGRFVAGERYFPDDLPDRIYYEPADAGLEIRIGEKLAALRAANRAAQKGESGAD